MATAAPWRRLPSRRIRLRSHFSSATLSTIAMRYAACSLRSRSVLAALTMSVLAAAPGRGSAPLILDMVHHNPGEARYETAYEDPQVIRAMGDNGKVFFLFDSPMLAVNWESVDPEILPKGSPGRAWVDAKAAQLDARHAACKRAGLKVYAMSDLILFPKGLVEKFHLTETFGDPRHPETQKYLRLLIAQMFDRFPHLDGLVVRIGETYLHDAPHHVGAIKNKTSASETIIPLMQLLREEVCVRRGKEVVFRTWLSFDTKLETYEAVSAAVEPHANLILAVKHCEGDFHRANPFSKVIGAGRHRQIIEVQCAREYEGKGAYPNYVAHGVIEGFEEHRLRPGPGKFGSIGEFARQSPLFAGIWTWSRGGGWEGPYLKNELWCDLNLWVTTQWALNPGQTEEEVFNRYAREKLGLQGEDVARFRRLCLLSASAVLRGRNTTHSDMNPWWTRDQYISRPLLPRDPAALWTRDQYVSRLPDSQDPAALPRVLAQKDEAVAQWAEIVRLAGEIRFREVATADYVVTSAHYGHCLFRIYRAVVQLAHANSAGDQPRLATWLADYDQAWTEFRRLPKEHPSCATLYQEKGSPWGPKPGVDELIRECRIKLSAQQ